MTMVPLPRAFMGKPVSANDWNVLVDAIQSSLITKVVGQGEVHRTAGGTILSIFASSSQPILLAKTVGRHDALKAQAVNLYTVNSDGTATETLTASEPEQVQAYNRIANLAGDVWIYITDLNGGGTIYEIIGGDPCAAGDTGGPN
jgi:hypothetical protein